MYEAYFGLAKLPFCIAPDSHFHVDAAPHRAALRALQDRLGHGDEFLPLVGDFGAGKTAVARRMLEEVDRARHVAAELPRMRIQGDQLFDRVAEAFGMRRAGGVPPLGSVIRQLEGLARDGREALLLVDEAHQLDVAALRRLRKLTAVRVEGRTVLHVCLSGRSMPPGVEELRRIGKPLNIGAPVRVEPLDAAGTHEYILERLGRAGWSGRPAFASATAAIHERCNGNPGRVNRLCGHILLQLYMQGRDDVSPDVVRAVDELLQAELRGEPATLTLPPLEPATPGPPTLTEVLPAVPPPARLDSAALATLLIAKTSRPPRPPDAVLAAPPLKAVVGVHAVKPRRRGLAQGVAALALLLTGAFLGQMVSNLAAARSESTRHATAPVVHDAAPMQTALPGPTALAPPTAPANRTTSPALPPPEPAGLAALAEQTIAQSPPAATQIQVQAEFAAPSTSSPSRRARSDD